MFRPLKELISQSFSGCSKLTGDGIHKIVKLPLEDIQRMLQDLLEVGFTLCDKVKLLLNSAAYGGQHQLCICNTHTDSSISSLTVIKLLRNFNCGMWLMHFNELNHSHWSLSKGTGYKGLFAIECATII